MSEVCGIVATVCVDICAGICIDFMSIRHSSCTEILCDCLVCRVCGAKDQEEDEIPERQRLLPDQRERNTQPGTQKTMQVLSP